ncbi:MAG TPA: hypothetical protein VJ691_04135 [Vicinamibacterales bacterium]|nr:hypothetical protein [Vicinamibacterales bacterium]
MIRIDRPRTPRDLVPAIDRLFELSAHKIQTLDRSWTASGAPVFTVEGRYTARGWTEWTEGFVYGAALLQFDATGERQFLDLGQQRTLSRMSPHLTHTGVHDHGFNNVSTYGNLWRLGREGRIECDPWRQHFCELALKASGAVQAHRWTVLPGGGFIHSFNGAHSLFVDTIRSLRALALSYQLGQRLIEEQDAEVSLLQRLLDHARATARFSVYYGKGRDSYDRRGRVAHESLFNAKNGTYRGPNSQQGYSPFTTWTRGLAWAMLGFTEQIEFLETVDDGAFIGETRGAIDAWMTEAAIATCDFYIDHAACADGIPYWDTGAPGLASLTGWAERDADPFNDVEPVDSSAAAIAAQALVRLGRILERRSSDGARYVQAGLRTLDTLIDPSKPYVSRSPDHQGLILHAIYHRPNGWDHVPKGSKIPRGESCQWGDYHAREAALYVKRLASAGDLTFFGRSVRD